MNSGQANESRTRQETHPADGSASTQNIQIGQLNRKIPPIQSLFSCVIDTPTSSNTAVSSVLEELEIYSGKPTVPMEVPKDPLDPGRELTPTKPF